MFHKIIPPKEILLFSLRELRPTAPSCKFGKTVKNVKQCNKRKFNVITP